jgi:hypothetical protein
MYHQPLTTCERMGNTCPSKHNCHRHEMPRSIETPSAALNARRDAGASACDLVMFINPVTTFVDPLDEVVKA